MKNLNLLKHPRMTEKAMNRIELNNELVFIVDKKATKKDIKEVFEKEFEAKIIKVNTMNDTKGRKKAIIKLSEETPAVDIATKLGMM
ncbi:MAG: 50S ribosomal protein L23 [Candidatus Aenigmarchaeota archaeon]|nr:50S ribosomal protein L23 [Candidatus Aenigmarchaeota archaeon]MCK5321969.1 50S ribosomal protein L23 [Candidatus Aenigmarchaeota archaeon]